MDAPNTPTVIPSNPAVASMQSFNRQGEHHPLSLDFVEILRIILVSFHATYWLHNGLVWFVSRHKDKVRLHLSSFSFPNLKAAEEINSKQKKCLNKTYRINLYWIIKNNRGP